MDRRQFLGALGTAAVAGCATAAAAGAVTRVALASCVDQTKPQPLWDAVAADRPDLVIFGGDNVYASERPWSAARLAQAYVQQERVPAFARLRASVPHLAIWDDHDYGANDGGAEFAHKHESKQVFLDFWRVGPHDPRRTREGIHHAQVFGEPGRRVQVILLDTRWFRSPFKVTDERGRPGRERYLPDADPAKTMLGAAQWQWLEQQLRQSAEVRLIVSGIQVVVEGHGWERWGNLPAERERLYRLIGSTGAQGVVFLSGDRHIGALYRETRGTPYALHELTASGVTHTWETAHEAGPNRLGDLFTQPHFGAVEVDWTARRMQLAIKDIHGVTQRSHAIPLDELKVNS